MVVGISHFDSLIIAKSLLYMISLDLRLLRYEVGMSWTMISILDSTRYRKIAFRIRFIRPISLLVRKDTF